LRHLPDNNQGIETQLDSEAILVCSPKIETDERLDS
jgi:hypothetical protein